MVTSKLNDTMLLSVAARAVMHDPVSWTGWTCLALTLPAPESWPVGLAETYLKGIEGRIMGNGKGRFYLLCRQVPEQVLQQVADHISHTTETQGSRAEDVVIFTLPQDAAGLAADLEGHADGATAPFFSVAAHSGRPHHRPARVLLVEDDPVTRWLVRDSVKNRGDLITASSIEQAKKIIATTPPDLVFLDIELPDGSGFQVLDTVMTGPQCHVVMFSSSHMVDNVIRAFSSGARGFIGKPFLKEQIIHYLDQV